MRQAAELLELMGKLIVGDGDYGKFRGSGGAEIFAKAGRTVIRPCPPTGWERWAIEELARWAEADDEAVKKLLTAMVSRDEFLDRENRVKESERNAQIDRWNGFLAPHGWQIKLTASGASVERVAPTYLPAKSTQSTPTAANGAGVEDSQPSRKVFIVHGHDDALKFDVARFVEKLGLEAIILAEQQNQGRTIIEKFEAHAETAVFAIVLLTPDDIGAAARDPSATRPRARQNVILELGYFIGSLKRSRVCAVHKGNVELPSDIHGIVYISVAENWKLQLAGEMKTAWPDLDLNNAY